MTEEALGRRHAIAGGLVVLSAASIAAATIVHGEAFVYRQLTSPVVGGLLLPVEVALTALIVVAVSLTGMILTLDAIEAVVTPRLYQRTGYTLMGAGALCGVAVATLASLTNHMVALPIGILPDGFGQSLIALAVVAFPTAYVAHRFWRPNDSLDALQQSQDDHAFDPEEVRRQREQWSEPPHRTAAGGGLKRQQAHQDADAETDNTPDAATETDESSADSDADHLEDTEYAWTRTTDVTLDHVGGMSDLKAELERNIIKPLTTEREAAEALGIPLPNVVFHGPPGTGKTYIAKALATELDLPFAKLSGSDIQSKWINESPTKIKTLFEEAATIANHEGGAIIFIDELDAVLKARRGAGNTHEEDNKVVAEFLNHLQETTDNDVLFIGATNRLDALDEAGIRAGRIDKKIHIGKPDHKARKAVLRAQLADQPHDLTDATLDTLAAATDGWVPAELEALIDEAMRVAAFDRGDTTITADDIKSAYQVQ